MLIYKICPHREWQAAVAGQLYRGSRDDMRDGFIHFSTAEQVIATAAKYFAGQQDLLLVAFIADQLGDDLRWEPSRGGKLFPHLYNSLNPHDACWVKELPLGANGHQFPSLHEEV